MIGIYNSFGKLRKFKNVGTHGTQARATNNVTYSLAALFNSHEKILYGICFFFGCVPFFVFKKGSSSNPT